AAISFGSNWRLQLAMSHLPSISAEMPVPVPPPLTVMTTSGLTFTYSRAQACATSDIVLEPVFSILIRFDLVQADEQQSRAMAATTRARCFTWCSLRLGVRF